MMLNACSDDDNTNVRGWRAIERVGAACRSSATDTCQDTKWHFHAGHQFHLHRRLDRIYRHWH